MALKQMTTWRTITPILMLAVLLGGVQNCVAQSPKAETAEQFAKKVLEIYKKKDIQQLLALAPDGPPPASELQQYAPGTKRYKSLFSDSSWRWTAVQIWNGEIASVRYDKRALVSFATAKNIGKTNFVRLHLRQGKWEFESMTEDSASDLARLMFNQVKSSAET